MKNISKILLLAAGLQVVISFVNGQADKYTNENRPYNFGFTIPGEQHRQESKDENGIIMGEFGYLTADGIYHETIFATDKDGNYRILSMKNRRVGPSPWGARTQAPPATTTTTTTTTTPPPPAQEFILRGKPGCSGCLIPTPPPPGSPPARPLVVPNIARFPSSGRPNAGAKPPGVPAPQGGRPGASPDPGAGRPVSSFGSPGSPGGRPGSPAGSAGPSGGRPGSPGSGPGSLGGRPISSGVIPAPPSGGKPFPPRGQFDDKPDPAFGTGKPNPLNPNAFPISNQQPTGLPGGLTNDDIMGLLYKFNYTVGFHGHQESGYRNGDKEGEFFVHNRDGTARKVTYVANEKGFQPKVTVVKIENMEDVPREETEKDYGLKGYEFKWFNRR